MSEHDGYWRMDIGTEQGSMSMHGTYDVLDAAFREWQEYANAPDGTTPARLLTIDGFTDSYDRAEMRCSVMLDSIRSMAMYRVSR